LCCGPPSEERPTTLVSTVDLETADVSTFVTAYNQSVSALNTANHVIISVTLVEN
jgi:hypothetical protein